MRPNPAVSHTHTSAPGPTYRPPSPPPPSPPPTPPPLRLPVASFTARSKGLIVSVDASRSHSDPRSSPGLSFEWFWDDTSRPETTSSPKCSHEYSRPDSYIITLVVRDSVGEDTTTVVIGVREPPKISGLRYVADGLTATIIHDDLPPGTDVTYFWEKKPMFHGGFSSLPSYTYIGGGTYHVLVVAENSEGIDTAEIDVTVNLEPEITGFTSDVDGLDIHLSFFLPSLITATFECIWGDGEKSTDPVLSLSGRWTLNHTYPAPGTYDISLLVVNSAGSDVARQAISVKGPTTIDRSPLGATYGSTPRPRTGGTAPPLRADRPLRWSDPAPLSRPRDTAAPPSGRITPPVSTFSTGLTLIIVLIVAAVAIGAYLGLNWLWHANDCTPNEITINGKRATCPQSAVPTSSVAPVSAARYSLPAGVKVRCGWTQGFGDDARFSSCASIKRTADKHHNVQVRFTVEGLNLRTWYRLSSADDGGSWTIELRTPNGSYRPETWNGDKLYEDPVTGSLVGADPKAFLYFEEIVNQSTDVPETVRVVLVSTDHPKLSRSFPVSLR